MDEFDELVLTIIGNAGTATPSIIQRGLVGTKYEGRQKNRIIARLDTLSKFGLVQIEIGETGNHGGRQPFFYKLTRNENVCHERV